MWLQYSFEAKRSEEGAIEKGNRNLPLLEGRLLNVRHLEGLSDFRPLILRPLNQARRCPRTSFLLLETQGVIQVLERTYWRDPSSMAPVSQMARRSLSSRWGMEICSKWERLLMSANTSRRSRFGKRRSCKTKWSYRHFP